MTVLSCRHLIHLSQEMGLTRNTIDMYQKQLAHLMSTCQQVNGISECTLFRKYEDKIHCAAKITKQLLYFQNEQLGKINQQQSYSPPSSQMWKKTALINKLKRRALNDSENTNRINNTIKIIENHKQNLISIMEAFNDSTLLQEATSQYSTAVLVCCAAIKKLLFLHFWGSLQPYRAEITYRDRQASNQNQNQKDKQSRVSQRKTNRKVEHASVLKRTGKSPMGRHPQYQDSRVTSNHIERDNIVSFNDPNTQFIRQKEQQRSDKVQHVSLLQIHERDPHLNLDHKKGDHSKTQFDSSKSKQHNYQVGMEEFSKIFNKKKHNPQKKYQQNHISGQRSKLKSNQKQIQEGSSILQDDIDHQHQQFNRKQSRIKHQSQFSMVVVNHQNKPINNTNIQSYSPSRLPKAPRKQNYSPTHSQSPPNNRSLENSQHRLPKHNQHQKENNKNHYQNANQHQSQLSNSRMANSNLTSHMVDVSILPKNSGKHGSQDFTERQRGMSNSQKGNNLIKQPQIRNVQTSIIYSSMPHRQNQHDLMVKKAIKLCQYGQYAMKRHYSSDGGEEKFFKLDKQGLLRWAHSQHKIQDKGQSYHLKDVKGFVYGKVTDTFLKSCNDNYQSWKCFSLILQKRTLDLYCPQQKDVLFWLPGLSAAALNHKNDNVPMKLFTHGRVLWKRMLMKLQNQYVRPLKKSNKQFHNANCFAVLQFAKIKLRINLENLKQRPNPKYLQKE